MRRGVRVFWMPAHLEQQTGIALAYGDDSIDYSELAQRVRQRETDLGDVPRLVAIEAGNDPEPIITYLACLSGGHVALLLTPGSGRLTDRDDIAATYQPDSVMQPNRTGVWTLKHLRSEPLGGLNSDLALLLSTSGSTGSPKLVRLSHQNLNENAAAICDYLGLGQSDAAATVLPWSYCYGLSVINTHFSVGGKIVLTDLSLADDCFWDLARSSGVTNISGVPYSFEVMHQNHFTPEQLPSLRILTQAGGKLAPQLVTEFAELCAESNRQFFVMYGQSEATARIAYLNPRLVAENPDCIGVAIPGGQLRIERNDDCLEGQGELVYSGPNVMMGYALQRHDLASNKTTWELHTGDIAERTDAGLYRVVGRCSRIAKPFGLRVDLDRLERILQKTCQEVTCVETPTGVGVVTTDSAVSTQELCKVAANTTGLPPTSLVVSKVTELPRLANGKIDYATAAQQSTDLHEGRLTPITADSSIATVLGSILGKSHISPTDSFVSLGGDSLSYVAATSALQQRIGTLPPGWQRLSVTELEALCPTSGGESKSHPRFPVRLETTGILRAVAVILIVGSHIGVFDIRGGAHLLIALAGFGLAKFLLTDADRKERVKRILRSSWRIVGISLLWLVPLVLISTEYGPSVLYLNNLLGPAGEAPEWRYWFLEALVYLMIAVAVLLWVPAVDRWERRWPFAFPLLIVGAGSVVALLTAGPTAPTSMYTPAVVIWLFAAGWALERASNNYQKSIVLLGVLVIGASFFNRPDRVALVLIGLILAITVTSVRVPRAIAPILSRIAGASLIIYLTHYQIYPLLGEQLWAALIISILAGVTMWIALDRLQKIAPRAARRVSTGASRARSTIGSPQQFATPLTSR
ncbi:MAG: AMP-dependent synthetase [Micrococcales bacterium]|nr:AMP-dependent synthetase [Micrococcales bacterium]